MLEMAESSKDGQNEPGLPQFRAEDTILFEEGLIGFPACKRFLLMENDTLLPFRVLHCVDQRTVGFLVLDPRTIVKNYNNTVPEDLWGSLDIQDKKERLALVISIIGDNIEQSTANLQAPLLINYKKMVGRQVILTNASYSVMEQLVPAPSKPQVRRRAAALKVR